MKGVIGHGREVFYNHIFGLRTTWSIDFALLVIFLRWQSTKHKWNLIGRTRNWGFASCNLFVPELLVICHSRKELWCATSKVVTQPRHFAWVHCANRCGMYGLLASTIRAMMYSVNWGFCQGFMANYTCLNNVEDAKWLGLSQLFPSSLFLATNWSSKSSHLQKFTYIAWSTE